MLIQEELNAGIGINSIYILIGNKNSKVNYISVGKINISLKESNLNIILIKSHVPSVVLMLLLKL